jgi:hypothetical protein
MNQLVSWDSHWQLKKLNRCKYRSNWSLKWKRDAQLMRQNKGEMSVFVWLTILYRPEDVKGNAATIFPSKSSKEGQLHQSAINYKSVNVQKYPEPKEITFKTFCRKGYFRNKNQNFESYHH